MGFRLIALDIDGTLLDSHKMVSVRTRAALDAAREQGVHLVLVTGRRHPAARKVAQMLGGEIPLVLHNGALIVEDGEVLRCRPLARESALQAIREGLARGADPVVHCGHQGEGRLLVQGIKPSNTLLVYYLDKSHPDVVTVDDLQSALLEDPLQVMFGGSIQEMDELYPHLGRQIGAPVKIERTVYPQMGVGILDVLEPSVGKAEALSYLLARWGVEAAETLAIGDNWNDREMLELAGLGMVMGNACAEMRELGLPVLPSNDEDGVAVAVEQYVLGG
jgi:Cof subfamily protein (haloacid dehalogenase superfamily)